MGVYFGVVISLLVLIVLNGEGKNVSLSKPRKITMLLISIFLATVAGLRYGVGTDYFGYYKRYELLKSSPMLFYDEPAINIIARVASYIFDDPATMMFLAAFITVVLITKTIYKNSDIYALSILLYIFMGYWHGCFNGVRQYLATAILFAGHSYIKERKFGKWCLVVCMASLCHITAVIGIFFYFYPQIKISMKNILVSTCVAFVGMNLYDYIFDMIEFLKNDTLDLTGQGASYLTNSINPLRIAVAWIPVIFFMFFRKYYDKNDDKFHFYMNMTILHAIFMTTAIKSTYLGRIEIYTGLYNTITWPLLLRKVEPSSKKIMVLFMLIGYAIYWCFEISGESLVDFQWIFLR